VPEELIWKLLTFLAAVGIAASGILWVLKRLGAHSAWQARPHRLHSTGPFLLQLGILIGIGIGIGIGIIFLATEQMWNVDNAVGYRSVIRYAVGIIFGLVFIYFVLLGWGRCEQLAWRSLVTLMMILLIALYAVLAFFEPPNKTIDDLAKTISVGIGMAVVSAILPLIFCNIFYGLGNCLSRWNKDFKKELGKEE